MSKKCPRCGSENIVQLLVYRSDGNGKYECQKCGYNWLYPAEPPQTVFKQITQSEETLAEKLVYYDYDGYWHSTIVFCKMFPDCFEDFNTEAEAIAATVAKLKEVAE